MNNSETSIEAYQYLQAILESAPYTIVATDCEGRIKIFNHHAEQELQYCAAEMIDIATPEIFHLKSEIVERSKELSKELGYTVKPGFDTFVEKVKNGGIDEYEWTYIRKDGTTFPAQISITTIKDKYGNTIGYMGISKDGTERKNFEDKIEEAKQQAESANKAKSQFLANMSHEIRTPMNAILGFSEILQDLENDSKKKDYINRINSSGNALLSLVNDILDLSKIEAGKFELQYQPCSLRNLCTDMQTIWGQNIRDKGLDFRINIDEKIPGFLSLDGPRLRQVLINLLSNSTKFTSEGKISLIVSCGTTVSINPELIDISILVKDTGIGIPKNQLNNIFDEFKQTDGQNQESYGGTGLGLAISQHLTRMMGGDITVESQQGLGSTFTVNLPDAQIIPDHESQDQVEDTLPMITFEPATILIADDIGYIREILTVYLSHHPFNLIYATNGKEVIYQTKQQHPDLILLDMKMPVMDGYEAARIIRATSEINKTPIVAVTASALVQDEDLIRQHCDEYLRKPLSKTALVKALIRFLSFKEAPSSACLEQQPKHPTPQKEQVQHTQTHASNPLKILVTEDNETNIIIIKAMLKKFDIDPVIANNGIEAVDLIQQSLCESHTTTKPYDLILMDCEMPKMNGFVAAQQIRKLEEKTCPPKGQIPIIAFSAHSREEIQQKLEFSGINDYLSKPLTLNKLNELLARYLPCPPVLNT